MVADLAAVVAARVATPRRGIAGYDWKVHQDALSPLEALEGLHAGAAYEFDPEVVASLRRLLETRGVLMPVRM